MRILVAIILTLCFAISEAQTYRRGEIFRIRDSDVYWAAVKTTYFREYVARQEEDCWCWAACVQMILRYNGIYESQHDIVSKVYGAPYDWSASGNEIADTFNDWNDFFPTINTIVSFFH